MGSPSIVVRGRNAQYDARLSEWYNDFDVTAQLFITRKQ